MSSSFKNIAPATTTNALKYESDIYFDGNMFGVSKQAQQNGKTLQQRRGVTGLANKAVSSILSRKFSSPGSYQDSLMNRMPGKPKTPSIKQKPKQEQVKSDRLTENGPASQSNVNLGVKYKNSFTKQRDELLRVEQMMKKPVEEAYNRTEIEAIAKTLSSSE